MTTKHIGKTEENTETESVGAGPTIPSKVTCVLGVDVPYETFKAHYKSIYDQVADMEHLLLGRIKFSGNLNGKLPFTLQSLKQAEVGLLQAFFPFNQADNTYLGRESVKYDLYKVVLSLVSIKNRPLPTYSITFDTTKEQWLESAKEVVDMLQSYDPLVLNYLSNVYEDMQIAKRFAFMELMPRF